MRHPFSEALVFQEVVGNFSLTCCCLELAEGSQGHSQLQRLAGPRGLLQMRENWLPNQLHRWTLGVQVEGNSYGELFCSEPV